MPSGAAATVCAQPTQIRSVAVFQLESRGNPSNVPGPVILPLRARSEIFRFPFPTLVLNNLNKVSISIFYLSLVCLVIGVLWDLLEVELGGA